MPSVFIVGGRDYSVSSMFEERDWKITNTPEEADALCYTGGADIGPNLYNQSQHPATHPSYHRDNIEVPYFDMFKTKAHLGICRGGQLLNVLNGGSMFQHVDRHANGSHRAYDLLTAELVVVTSLHHQMMIPAEAGAEILAVSMESSFKEFIGKNGELVRVVQNPEEKENLQPHEWRDIEALFYPISRSLCFQGHPEFGNAQCTDYFFRLIDRHINFDQGACC